MTLSDDQLKAARQEAVESATVWFAVLERARLTNDSNLEEDAQRALYSLGITVSFQEAAST